MTKLRCYVPWAAGCFPLVHGAIEQDVSKIFMFALATGTAAVMPAMETQAAHWHATSTTILFWSASFRGESSVLGTAPMAFTRVSHVTFDGSIGQ
jgi:hypothetical protein